MQQTQWPLPFQRRNRRKKCSNTDLDVDYNYNIQHIRVSPTFKFFEHWKKKKSLLPVLEILISSCSSLITNQIYEYERRHLKSLAWALGYCDSPFSSSSDISLDKNINWKLICSPLALETTKQQRVDVCYDQHWSPCGWDPDKWKAILGVYLSKCAQSISLSLFIAPGVVYLLFDCSLKVARKKIKTILPPEHHGRHGDRGKTHSRFVWCNHFLERVYSQAFRAMFCYFCTLGKRCTRLSFPEKPVNMLRKDLNTVCSAPLAAEFWLQTCFCNMNARSWKMIDDSRGAGALKILLSAQITSGMSVLSGRLHRKKIMGLGHAVVCSAEMHTTSSLVCEPHAFFTMWLITFSGWFFIFNQLLAPWVFTCTRVAINMQWIYITDMHVLCLHSLSLCRKIFCIVLVCDIDNNCVDQFFLLSSFGFIFR